MTSPMKRGLLAAFTMLAIAATACSGGTGFKEAAGGTLGAGGGELRTGKDEFSLNVPAGALTADTAVKVTMNTAGDLMGIDQASPVFEIQGLTAYSKPLKIQIKANKPLGGETYAVVGQKALAPSGAEESMGYVYLPCTVNGDLVEFTLDPAQVLTGSQRFMQWLAALSPAAYADTPPSIGPVIQAAVITNQSSQKTAHFTIIADSDVKTIDKETVAAYMDFLYKFYTDMGFDLDKYQGWPLQVKIRGLYRGLEKNFFGGGDQDAGYYYKVPGVNPWIVVNKQLLSSFDNVRITLIHEFFHFVQGLYGSGNTWFDEATATWVEEYYTANSGLLPLNYNGLGESELQIFSPLDLLGRSEAQHGYGSAALIKYLEGKHGRGKIVEVYKNIGSYESAEAALNAFAPMNSWINDFNVSLIQSRVYSSSGMSIPRIRQDAAKVEVQVIPGEPDETGSVSPPGEPAKQNLTLAPYGAKFVSVALKSTDAAKVADSAALVATAESETVAVTLFKMKGTDQETALGGAMASLPGVKASLTDKSVILAMVTNLTNKPLTTDVTFEVNTPPPLEQLVGDWTTGKITYTNIYLHPELLKQAGIVSSDPAPADGENPFVGCDEAMGAAIAQAFAEMKKLQGTTEESHLRVAQTGPEAGTAAISTARDDLNDFGDPIPFTYKDGKLTANYEQASGEGSAKAIFDMNAVYHKKTSEIVLSGTMTLELWGEGAKALAITMAVEYRKPIPEGAFAASLPLS